MKIKRSFHLVWPFLWFSLNAHAVEPPNPRIVRAIDFIIKEDYRRAAAILDSAIARESSNPAGYFYYGVIFWRESSLAPDFEFFDQSLQTWLEHCMVIADSAIDLNARDANAWFYHGGAHGFLGSMYARKGNWLKTGYHAWKGVSALEKALELNPEMYDIYYGLGLYHVMAGHQGAIVRFIQKFLPIPTGDPAKGISALKMAIENGRYASVPAQSALVFAWLYFENDYQQALNTLIPLLEKYPESTDLLAMRINTRFYLQLNEPSARAEALLDDIGQFEKVVARRKLEINLWWVQKLVFLKGYAHYSLGNDEIALRLLKDYTDFFPRHGNSYLIGLADLMQGKIYDLRGQREMARKKYRQAKAAENFGNVSELADRYLKKPELTRNLPVVASVTGFPERP